MIEIERCPKCNANLAMVGRSHRCVPMPDWAGDVPNSSDGGVESRHAAGVVPEQPVHGIGSEHRVRKERNRPQAGVAPGPSEAKPKKKRAPNGTFDRKTYQRDLMRKRRQEEARRKKEQGE